MNSSEFGSILDSGKFFEFVRDLNFKLYSASELRERFDSLEFADDTLAEFIAEGDGFIVVSGAEVGSDNNGFEVIFDDGETFGVRRDGYWLW